MVFTLKLAKGEIEERVRLENIHLLNILIKNRHSDRKFNPE